MNSEQTKKKNLKIFGIILILIVLGFVLSNDDKSKSKPAETENLTNAQKDSIAKEKLILAAFSQWDGSHYNLVKYTKENMHDPSSFEHVTTSMYKGGDSTLIVVMTYRGKNVFGGLVKNVIRAETQLDGTLIKVFNNQ